MDLTFGRRGKKGRDDLLSLGVANVLFPALDVVGSRKGKEKLGSGAMYGGTKSVNVDLLGTSSMKGSKSRKRKKSFSLF